MRIILLLFLLLSINLKSQHSHVISKKHYDNGTWYYNNGKYEKALKSFTQAIYYHKNSDAYLARANTKKALKDSIGYCEDLFQILISDLDFIGEGERLLYSDCAIQRVEYFLSDSTPSDSTHWKFKIITLSLPLLNKEFVQCIDLIDRVIYAYVKEGDTMSYIVADEEPSYNKEVEEYFDKKIPPLYRYKKEYRERYLLEYRFIIDTEGQIIFSETIVGYNDIVDKKIEELLLNSPKFNPATHNGKKVVFEGYLPIVF